MEKKYIIGGLAIVGALALFAYLKPTSAKRNSGGFFGADGQGGCAVCYESGRSGNTYWATNGRCRFNHNCKRSLIKQKAENDAQNNANSIYG